MDELDSHSRHLHRAAICDILTMTNGTINWSQILIQAGLSGVAIAGPLLFGGYLAWKQLGWVLKEYRLHRHYEKRGPLTAAGIEYPRNNPVKEDADGL